MVLSSASLSAWLGSCATPPPLGFPLSSTPCFQNDAKKLAEAKQLVYLKGFTDGVLIVGEHKGKKVRNPVGSSILCRFGHAFFCGLA